VLSQEIARLNEDAGVPSGTPRKRLPVALRKYNQNRVARAAAVQGLSRISSAFHFQYQPPLEIEWSSFPPKVRNTGPRSLITRACQGFLQYVAFPAQFEFLFSFPGAIRPDLFEDDQPGDFGAGQPAQEHAEHGTPSGPSEVGKPERELLESVASGKVKDWFAKYW